LSTLGAERALIILKYIATSQDGYGIREIARKFGYSPSAVQKIVQALVTHDFVLQDPRTQVYQLGPAALQVGLSGLSNMEVRQVAKPYLQALSEKSGETALLGVKINNGIIYVEKSLSPNSIRMDPPIGAFRPFNCTAVGKCILANETDEEIEKQFRENFFMKSTPNSIIDPAALKEEIRKVRERGFALDREEYEEGAMCVGAPVKNFENHIIAAIAVAGPVSRVDNNEETLIKHVVDSAKNISKAFGFIENGNI
jgi:IclR family transcriptional regulator, KDG regulon repressor